MKAMMIGAVALAGATVLAASPASAQANMMKDCAAKYQAAKAGGTLPAGQSWIQYLAQCRKATPAAVPVASASRTTAIHTVQTQATTRTNAPVHAPGQRTPGQIAEASRQKQCGAQWKADKAAGKTGSQTWPQYWSACSKRLKG
jgi:hypothetical protein